MAVVVLPPQDCLNRPNHNQKRLISPNKPRRNPSLTNPSYQPSRSNRRRRNSNSPPPSGPVKAHSPPPGPTGPIRILKRGEDLPKPVPEPVLARPVVGPIINGFYAGSACVTSPPPSELPLPAFFTRSCGLSLVTDDVSETVKIATDLRRVLKLC